MRASLYSFHRERKIDRGCEENHRQCRTAFAQPRLQLQTSQPEPHVEKNAARRILARQSIQKILGGQISRDFITGLSQARCDQRPERGIVIHNMHETLQEPLHAALPNVARGMLDPKPTFTQEL